MSEFWTKRRISHEEAQEALSRFEASHFHKTDKEHARISIPANPDRDDDLVLGAYIRQQAASEKEYQEVIEAAKELVNSSPIADDDLPYISENSWREFRILAAAVARLTQGGGG